MLKSFLLMLVTVLLMSCRHEKTHTEKTSDAELPNEINQLYSAPETQLIYSKTVGDTFKIFSSLPDKYDPNSVQEYPLILMLDANAYFEAVVSELKLGTLTQGYPKSIVIGIGYKTFALMDSLRDRDYTFPKSISADSFGVSGGGQQFKQFIDKELLPSLLHKYRVNTKKVILMGHSLGGYFSLYYMLDSFGEDKLTITNFIAASPSLFYGHDYLFTLQEKVTDKKNYNYRLYISSGSLERDSTEKENKFLLFKDRWMFRHPGIGRIKYDEYSNFAHMDAAIPGFMKGLSFVYNASN